MHVQVRDVRWPASAAATPGGLRQRRNRGVVLGCTCATTTHATRTGGEPLCCSVISLHTACSAPYLPLARAAAVPHVALLLALRQGYSSTYTISGCSDPADCGVFKLVPANCTDTYEGRCPGGRYANGNTDRTLCDGAPAYQSADGTRVLLRWYSSGFDYTSWRVAGSYAPHTPLSNCFGGITYLLSASINGRLGYAPTAPGYDARDQGQEGWLDDNNSQRGRIRVTAGGGH